MYQFLEKNIPHTLALILKQLLPIMIEATYLNNGEKVVKKIILIFNFTKRVVIPKITPAAIRLSI
jgi:hypothetical protein